MKPAKKMHTVKFQMRKVIVSGRVKKRVT